MLDWVHKICTQAQAMDQFLFSVKSLPGTEPHQNVTKTDPQHLMDCWIAEGRGEESKQGSVKSLRKEANAYMQI